MLFSSVKTFLITYSVSKSYNNFFSRYVRKIAPSGTKTRFLEAKVKTVKQYEPDDTIENYKDFVKSIKNSKLGDELEIQRSFIQDDYFGHPVERVEQYYDIHEREEKYHKSLIKKQIINRKYFKLDKETNLLTYAAKEQIRYLHSLNPQEWNPAAIAECFPISEAGVKKLLKSNFTVTDPEKIKAHDEAVSERWIILKSGKFTTAISSLTQKLYKEGKLTDDYCSGNPNFPAVPKKKVIQLEKAKKNGEFSAIVQTFADHEKQKLLENSKEDCSESQLTLTDKNKTKFSKGNKDNKVMKFKIAHEEFDDDDDKTELDSNMYRKQNLSHMDLPLSQFKEILKEENQNKGKNNSDNNNELFNEPVSKYKKYFGETHTDPNCFLKITKYNKEKHIDVMYDKQKNNKTVYKYDDNLGYQYPIGKNIKGNIKLPQTLNKAGKLFKLGNSVYNENGEFLYKVPS